MTSSAWETYFESQLIEAGFTGYVREYKFHPKRGFRFDFCFKDIKLALEVNGGVYSKGGHTSGPGYSKDMEKLALAAIEGYTVIQMTTGQVSNGQGIEWVQEYFNRNVEGTK